MKLHSGVSESNNRMAAKNQNRRGINLRVAFRLRITFAYRSNDER